MTAASPLEAGLQHVVALWEARGAGLVSRRLEGALGRTFRLEELGGPVFHLQLERGRALWGDGAGDSAPHAEIRMSAADWARVLTGEWSIVAVVLAGRAPYPKHQRRYLMQLSLVLQTLLLSEANAK
jgi:hypothetical protein